MKTLPSISWLANHALVQMSNRCGRREEWTQGTFILVEEQSPIPIPDTYSPLGLYLGQCIITTELKAFWQLPADKKDLEHSCATAIENLRSDFRRITDTYKGEPEHGWKEWPSNPSLELVFARPAFDGREPQATASDFTMGLALRATLINPNTVEIAVNFGVRYALQCR
jgi:hypothetical protein